MKSSFAKHVKRQSKNRGCNGNAKFGDRVLEKKKALHKYVHIYKCIYSYVTSSVLKHNNQTWQAYFLEWRLTCFGKELFNYSVLRSYETLSTDLIILQTISTLSF